MQHLTTLDSLSADHKAALVRPFAIVGETVVVDTETRFINETDAERASRLALLADRTLTVADTFIEPSGVENLFYVKHCFNEIEGAFHAGAFRDPRPQLNGYGVFLEKDDAFWFVQLDTVDGIAIAGARRISEELPDWTRRISDVDSVAEAASLVDPVTRRFAGEVHLLDNGDGTWALGAIPWTTSASPEEAAVADDQIAKTIA